jgi:ribonuclease P protein component
MPLAPESAKPRQGRRFGPASRLRHDAEYQAVFDAKLKKAGGGLVVFARPNGLKRARLGLSVGKGAGGAIERNRVKRWVREAFREMQHELPRLGESSYDIVVGARSGKGMTLESVRRVLRELVGGVHGVYEKRARRERGE